MWYSATTQEQAYRIWYSVSLGIEAPDHDISCIVETAPSNSITQEGDKVGTGDCCVVLQVTWVAMIICILFFEMNLATALWTGLIVGIAYTMFARAMYRQQLAVLQREMAREHQQHLHPRSAAGSSPR